MQRKTIYIYISVLWIYRCAYKNGLSFWSLKYSIWCCIFYDKQWLTTISTIQESILKDPVCSHFTLWMKKHFGFSYYIGLYRVAQKNATLTINNSKKTRDRMKKLCTLLRIKFFSQQDDAKIVNFDEGVLILWPFFWGNVISKICPSISKVTIYVPKIVHCLASLGIVSALAL